MKQTLEIIILYLVIIFVLLLLGIALYLTIFGLDPKSEINNEIMSHSNCTELKQFLNDNLLDMYESQILKALVKLQMICPPSP